MALHGRNRELVVYTAHNTKADNACVAIAIPPILSNACFTKRGCLL